MFSPFYFRWEESAPNGKIHTGFNEPLHPEKPQTELERDDKDGYVEGREDKWLRDKI